MCMQQFAALTIEPCLRVEPRHSLDTADMDSLVARLMSGQEHTPAYIKAALCLATGQLRRHPALHGLTLKHRGTKAAEDGDSSAQFSAHARSVDVSFAKHSRRSV